MNNLIDDIKSILQKQVFTIDNIDFNVLIILKILLPVLVFIYLAGWVIRFIRKKDVTAWKILGRASKIIEILLRLVFLAAGFSIGFRIAKINVSVFYYFYLLLSHPIVTLGSSPVSVLSIVFFVLILYGMLFIARSLNEFLKHDIYPQTTLNRGVQDVINTFLKYLLIAVGVIVGLQINGINLSVLATIGAGLMVGIGFGLQNIANNFISGIIILLERPIKVGDFIEMENVSGVIQEISSRSTRIKNNQNIIMIVPNSKFISENVINWSHNNEIVKLEIPVSISYESDPDLTTKVLLDIANDNSLVLKNPKSDVHLVEFGDSSINFLLLVWIDQAFKRREVVSEINYEIYRRFKKENIQIPFPQLDVNFSKKK